MAAPSFISLVKGAAADLANAAAGAIRLFVDDGTGEPSYKDESGTVVSLQGAPGADAPAVTYQDHGNTGSTETIDASAADIHRLVANAATVTLTLTGWPASGTPGLVYAELVQDGTGGRNWVFPGAVDWGTAGEPDWTTHLAGAVDLVKLFTTDGGTHVYASIDGRPGPTGATGAAGANGTNGTNGTNGVDGANGGAITIDYTFSTTTTDSDPGNGNLRLSNATQASAVTIRADLLDSHGVDWSAVLATLADASNTVKGHIRLFKKSDPTKWLLFTVSAVATPSGYDNITVANVGRSGANPLGNGDAIVLAFSRSGDQGSTVGAGTLTTIEEVDGSPTDSAVTKLVLPNGTLAIAAHVATYSPIYAGSKWTVGTSMPGSPSTGDRVTRTDLNMDFVYDGTRWLSVQVFTMAAGAPADANIPISGNVVFGRAATWHTSFALWLLDLYITSTITGTNNGSNYWSLYIRAPILASNIAVADTSADTSGVLTGHKVAINAALGSTEREIDFMTFKNGAPGNIVALSGFVSYRLIGV